MVNEPFKKIPVCKVCKSPMLSILSVSEVEHICSPKCLSLRLEMANMLVTDEFVKKIFNLKKPDEIKKKIRKFAKKHEYKKKLITNIVFDRGNELKLKFKV